MENGLLRTVAERLFQTREQHKALELTATYVNLLKRIGKSQQLPEFADIGLQALTKLPHSQQIRFFRGMIPELTAIDDLRSTVAKKALATSIAPELDALQRIFGESIARLS